MEDHTARVQNPKENGHHAKGVLEVFKYIKKENMEIGVKQEDLEDSIIKLQRLKPVMQNILIKNNYEGKGQADAVELGKHFDMAIIAMVMLLAEFPRYRKKLRTVKEAKNE